MAMVHFDPKSRFLLSANQTCLNVCRYVDIFTKYVSIELLSTCHTLESELPENVCNFFNIGFFFFFSLENGSHWSLKVHDSLIFVYFS